MNKLFKITLIFIGLFSKLSLIYSQEQIEVQRIKGEFVFDGVVDDVCWQNVKPLSMVMHTPTFGNQTSEKSEVMICYDNTFLYVGASYMIQMLKRCSSLQKNVMSHRF
jgi:hypothetical protein